METVRTVIYAVLIATVVRTFAYEPFNIPSKSMVPTLLVGDYLFVSKLSYGYSRYSLPLGLPLFEGRIWPSEPERGDVIVFKLPTDNETDYIKRVIGLPGDTIQMISGILHINGQPVERERIEDYVDPDSKQSYTQYLELLPNGVRHRILEESDKGTLDNTPPYRVPDGHYFMMGDNRDNSLDSRASVGFVPAENLIGRAEILFFSTNGDARLWEIWNWPSATRFSRIFDAVS
jgi:signal peptidase I